MRLLVALLFVTLSLGAQPGAKRRAVRQPSARPAPMSVMWIGAHPDDEAVAAPLLAKWCIDENARCAFLVLTRGEAGPCLLPGGCHPDVASVRAAESEAAARYFGAASIQLDFSDGGGVAGPAWSPTAAATIAHHIEAFRPELILTFDPRHGTTCHPDHRETGRLVLEAVEGVTYAPQVYLLETLVVIGVEPLSIDFVPALSAVERFDATHTWHAVVEDMRRHPSQFDQQWVDAIENVLPQNRAVYIAPAARVLQQTVGSCP